MILAVSSAHAWEPKTAAFSSQAEFKRLFGSLWKVKTVSCVVKDIVRDSSGKQQQKYLVLYRELSRKDKRCTRKLCNIRIDEPKEMKCSKNEDRITALSLVTLSNPEKVEGRYQENVTPVNQIFESRGRIELPRSWAPHPKVLIGWLKNLICP